MEIMQHCAPDIIAGDFNAEPNSRAMAVLREGGYIEAVPKNVSAEPWIDHVFISPEFHRRWEITDASWIIATQPVPGVREAISDHDGILVELTRR
jgi:endonuclease/exonuclease/phosphatase family metal-dependent hydrolase